MVGDAMGGVIELTESQWETLATRLRQDNQHQPSVMLIRSRMREVLGFTTRQHQRWIETEHGYGCARREVVICLDFFDARMETWFRLRYAEYLNDRQE
jgi:hypothetical protein